MKNLILARENAGFQVRSSTVKREFHHFSAVCDQLSYWSGEFHHFSLVLLSRDNKKTHHLHLRDDGSLPSAVPLLLTPSRSPPQT